MKGEQKILKMYRVRGLAATMEIPAVGMRKEGKATIP